MCLQMINSPFSITKYEKYIEIILLSRSVSKFDIDYT